jgi:hypothetical protein
VVLGIWCEVRVQFEYTFEVASHLVFIILDLFQGKRTHVGEFGSCGQVHEILKHLIKPFVRFTFPPNSNQSDGKVDRAKCPPLIGCELSGFCSADIRRYLLHPGWNVHAQAIDPNFLKDADAEYSKPRLCSLGPSGGWRTLFSQSLDLSFVPLSLQRLSKTKLYEIQVSHQRHQKVIHNIGLFFLPNSSNNGFVLASFCL